MPLAPFWISSAAGGLFGILTLFVVSVVVFLATQVLPGNAAAAVLGRNANPARLRAPELSCT